MNITAFVYDWALTCFPNPYNSGTGHYFRMNTAQDITPLGPVTA